MVFRLKFTLQCKGSKKINAWKSHALLSMYNFIVYWSILNELQRFSWEKWAQTLHSYHLPKQQIWKWRDLWLLKRVTVLSFFFPFLLLLLPYPAFLPPLYLTGISFMINNNNNLFGQAVELPSLCPPFLVPVEFASVSPVPRRVIRIDRDATRMVFASEMFLAKASRPTRYCLSSHFRAASVYVLLPVLVPLSPLPLFSISSHPLYPFSFLLPFHLEIFWATFFSGVTKNRRFLTLHVYLSPWILGLAFEKVQVFATNWVINPLGMVGTGVLNS